MVYQFYSEPREVNCYFFCKDSIDTQNITLKRVVRGYNQFFGYIKGM
jgi:hypothetical protein